MVGIRRWFVIANGFLSEPPLEQPTALQEFGYKLREFVGELAEHVVYERLLKGHVSCFNIETNCASE